MTPRETKFILRAHRADGRYPPDDPLFAEALAEAARSADLMAWLKTEHAIDQAVAGKLEAIAPPPGLRETILAGGRASRLHRPAWWKPRWLALAAVLAVLIAAFALGPWSRPDPVDPLTFARFALANHANEPHAHNYVGARAAIAASLSARAAPLNAAPGVTAEELHAANCAQFKLGPHRAYEICFQRDGAWFHLYVTRLDPAHAPHEPRAPVFLHEDRVAAAAWSDGKYLYSLVTRAGPEVLARLVQA